MTFYEMLEQVIELLQRHERLSYRALKVQFELDDDHLDLLKEELIAIQEVARDQGGRMLVWADTEHTASDSSPQLDQSLQEEPAIEVESLPAESHTPEA